MAKKSNAQQEALKYKEHKKQIMNLIKSGELDMLKDSPEYFDIMKHYWLVDKYIAKFGVTSEAKPENTLGAYQNAVKKGYAILIPVQALNDGEVICYKDKTIATSTNASGYIPNLTLADVKENKIVGSNESIPTLNEALEVIAGKVPVIIEVLNEGLVGETEEKVLNIVEAYLTKFNLDDSIAIMSLNPYSLQWFKEQAPWLPRIIRSGKFKVKTYAGIKTKKLRKLTFSNKLADCDYVCYNSKDLPYRRINKIRPIGVLAYNVKSQEEYLKVAKYCDNIIFEDFEPTI